MQKVNHLRQPVATINSNLGGLSFAKDANGKWGYRVAGADPVIPFKSYEKIASNVSGQMTFDIKSIFPNSYNNFTPDNFIISAIQSSSARQPNQTNGHTVSLNVIKTVSNNILTTKLSARSSGVMTGGIVQNAETMAPYDVYALLT